MSSVVVVGTGIAGAIVAKRLLEDSAVEHVTMLDAGGVVPQMDGRRWMDYLTTWKLPYDGNTDRRMDYDVAGQPLAFEGGRLVVRGGSTMHWGGWAFRYKPEDFRAFSSAGRELDWAFSYDDLEPYYWRAEQLIGVAGASADRVPPRPSGSYPFAAPAMVAGDRLVIEGLDKLGVSYSNFPVARYADRCVTTGTCRYCPVGGRYSATQTLDALERTHGASGRFTIRSQVAVQRIVVGPGHTARGVAYRPVGEDDVTVLDADLIIVAAGAIETPKILLASKSSLTPAGLGNASGHVGRHFKIHPMLHVDARFRGNPMRVLQELDFPTLASRHFDTEREQRDGKLLFGRTSRMPQLDIEGMMADGRSARDIDALVSQGMTLTLSGFIEEFASAHSAVGIADGMSSHGLSRTRVTYAPLDNTLAIRRHLATMGRILEAAGGEVIDKGLYQQRIDHTASTTRMSKDAAVGVVDSDLRVHGTDNVYVCSTSVFPTISATPPTLTLAAVALRLGDHLAARLRN
ncbi:GMC oxidoreductase [Luteibacter rhizovicinus]|nr:GMC family oxidoreductase [Luteibacter rhizovicinus]KLD67103.1 hypothetical protein Y883_09045 [Luteibacter rhizovicinus DSM 16549]